MPEWQEATINCELGIMIKELSGTALFLSLQIPQTVIL